MDKFRRAELKRQYTETRRPVGVYRIRNTVNGKIFVVGASVDIQARINRHKTELQFHSGKFPGLAEDSVKYGADSFEFEILETLDGEYETDAALQDDLKLLEEMWLEKCEPYDDKGYNTRVS